MLARSSLPEVGPLIGRVANIRKIHLFFVHCRLLPGTATAGSAAIYRATLISTWNFLLLKPLTNASTIRILAFTVVRTRHYFFELSRAEGTTGRDIAMRMSSPLSTAFRIRVARAFSLPCTMLVTMPVRPTRAVRPARWTYCAAVFGKSKLMTFQMMGSKSTL